MATCIREKMRTARKKHEDSSWHWIEYGCLEGASFSELRAVALLKQRRGRILPGMCYLEQVMVDNAIIYVYRSLPELNAICEKYDLWVD